MKNNKLTATQEAVLTQTAEAKELDPANLSLNAGARKKVLDCLVKKDFLNPTPEGLFTLTTAGRAAIGMKDEQKPVAKAKGKIRTGTKLHTVIELLSRPEGAEIHQIMRETGWQQHTVRGTLAGALKKRLGLTIESEKPEGRDRVYRITGGLEGVL